MGSFLGHLVPGTFFTLFSLWWIFSIFRRYFIAKKFHPNGVEGYQSTVSFPCFLCSRRLNIEGYIKIISIIIGITGETVTAFENGHWTHIGNAQHITMFAFFGFTGLLDILYEKKCNSLPRDLDYAASFLAFVVEGFLFFNHLHGRTHMDIQVHMMLFCTIVACALSILCEANNRNNVILALSRSYFTLLQGTWFFQVGFILYPPFSFLKTWDQTNHEEMMITTLMYAWHAAAHCVVILCMAFWIKAQVDKMAYYDEEEFLSWTDNSLPKYTTLNNMENLWTRSYKDNVEEPGTSKAKFTIKKEVDVLDGDTEAVY